LQKNSAFHFLNNNKRYMNKTLLVIAALVAANTVQAQIHQPTKKDSSMTSRMHELNPIVVTGAGHHQRLKTTPTPVHVLSAKDIKEQGVTTFDDAILRMMPQVSMAPNGMGSQIRLNGLGNKYILILINGHKMSGDISNNIDLNRINMARVKRIEVLDGAASSLYGSDAIGGVINIITEQPTEEILSLTSSTRVSGKGKLTESVNLDIFANGFGSYTTFTHDEANSYNTYGLEYVDEDGGETQPTIAPLYTGYRSNLLSQKFTYSPNSRLALNAGIEAFYKKTDRPETNADITGGQDYEMRYKGLRWNLGGIYKFSRRNSLQVDFTADRFRYGKEYDVETKSYKIGDYIQSKKQKTLEAEAKAILGLVDGGTTIVGFDWRKDYMVATSGNIDSDVYSIAGYLQHEQRIVSGLKATAGVRYTYHETAGNHFSPKVALMYSPDRHFNFRATYSAGFRAPGLDELFYHYFSVNRNKPQISFGNKDLSPEKSNYISLNAEYNSDVFSVGVTGFMNFIDNMIVKDYVDIDDANRAMLMDEFPEMTQAQADKLTSYALYMNSDKGEVKGLQAQMAVRPFKDFSLSASYAYIYARSKSGDEWTLMDRSIKNTATVAANYSHRWGEYALNVNVNGRLQSTTYYSAYENAPGFGVWNVNTTHTIDCLDWVLIQPSIGVDNIFDRVDTRIDGSKRRYALYSPGRMLTVGLTLKLK